MRFYKPLLIIDKKYIVVYNHKDKGNKIWHQKNIMKINQNSIMKIM